MGLLNIGAKMEEATPLEVEWGGDKFNAEVCLEAASKRFFKEVFFGEDGAEKFIAKIYKSADISLDGENKIELTEENLSELPPSLLEAMVSAVTKAREAKKKTE